VKQKRRKICPDCKLVNPESAEECYCGYKFEIENDGKSNSLLSNPSMIMFTVLVLLMIGFMIFSMVEGILFASCDRLNIN
jgi:hypothetical protein